MIEKPSLRTPHVLLVEDNPGDILLVKESFREISTPHRLSVARDGQEALDFVHGAGQFAGLPRPDLILLDLNLPKISGLDVLAQLKSNAAFQNIPVVVLSTSTSPMDIQKSYALAANCYLCKPNGLEEFFHLMRVVQEFWLRLVEFPSAHASCEPKA